MARFKEFTSLEDARDYIFKHYDWLSLNEFEQACDEYIFASNGKYVVPSVDKL